MAQTALEDLRRLIQSQEWDMDIVAIQEGLKFSTKNHFRVMPGAEYLSSESGAQAVQDCY